MDRRTARRLPQPRQADRHRHAHVLHRGAGEVFTERDLTHRTAILDRDGTIIVERNYLSDPDEVQLLPGAAGGMRLLMGMGYRLIVVTNQSGIARGYFDEARLAQIHQSMWRQLRAESVELSGVYFCPHLPDDACPCRKPAPGLVNRAAAEHGFDPASSVVIGDNVCDIELGRAVGARTILVRTGYGREVERSGAARADFVADDLAAAAEYVQQTLASRQECLS